MIHRDVKPENIILVEDASGFRAKVLDFGIAKTMAFEKGLTQTGMVVGTPAYMSPEQIRGEEVDSRSDLYSFAAVCYEALTGQRAVAGGDFGQVLINVLSTPPIAISRLLPGIPTEVDRAFESAPAKERVERQEDIEQWGRSFAEVLESHPPDPQAGGWPAPFDGRPRTGHDPSSEAETIIKPGERPTVVS